MIRGAAHKVAHLVVEGEVYIQAPMQGAGTECCAGCAGERNTALCKALPDCVDDDIIFIKRNEAP